MNLQRVLQIALHTKHSRMAPDIDTLSSWSTPGYANNGVPRADPEIPDAVMGSPAIRKIRVISIGAGVSGMMNAYYIQKQCENVEHVIYEKNEDIGGTWLENTYPGCACDIPSHAYTYPFALNARHSNTLRDTANF